MASNPFAGTWKLVSYEVRRADGKVTYPWGDSPQGRLMYSEDDYVSVAMMGSDRTRFAARELKLGTPQEKVAAVDSYISYAGRYEVVGGNKVVHHVEVSLFPNWVGRDQVRSFKFDGNRLMLTTEPDPNDEKRKTGHLIWERL
jgi:hypothetical protein